MKFRPLLILLFSFFGFHTPQAAPLIESDPNLPEEAFSLSQEPHDFQLLNSGLAGLEKRLQLIESAKNTIEVEYFIFDTDLVGRLFLQALIRKAKAGVKVRFLVDDTPISGSIDDYVYTLLANNKIEVRYYNHAWFWQFNKLNHRSHKKSLIIDSEMAIVGGRNIGDEYFDIHQQFNYLDRDVYVKGPIVKSIRKSFSRYWNISKSGTLKQQPTLQQFGFESEKQARQESHRSEVARQNYRAFKRLSASYKNGMAQANNMAHATAQDSKTLQLLHEKATPVLSNEPIETCHETYFLADLPGFKKHHRVVYDKLKTFFDAAKSRITAESLYLILSSVSPEFQNALERGVDLDVMTNSLNSAGNPLAVGAFYYGVKELIRNGAEMYVYNGRQPQNVEMLFSESQSAKWSLHTKSVVIDDDTSIIMSYNFDPRSKNINAEMALVCRGSTGLAQSLRKDIQERRLNSEKLNQEARPLDGREKHFDASLTKKVIYYIAKPFARVFEFLL